MTENNAISKRVDRYLRGELDTGATAAFEAELLDSAELQDALESALGVQRAMAFTVDEPAANVVPLKAPGGAAKAPPRRQPPWGLAASLALAAVAAGLLWRSEAENAQLQSRVVQLEQPVESVITVPLDVMRSFGSDTPDVRIRKPAGAALLVLDVEVAGQLAGSPVLNLELNLASGETLMQWSSAPDSAGRIQVALRTDRVPDGLLTLVMRATEASGVDSRSIELLPAKASVEG